MVFKSAFPVNYPYHLNGKMNMDTKQFEDHLVNVFSLTTWEWVDNAGACDMIFTQTHAVVRESLYPYMLELDVSKNSLTLTLLQPDDTLLGILTYDTKKQRWFGRSFLSGYIQISPASNIPAWKAVSDPRKFMKSGKIEKVAGVNYIDEIPMDYIVPTYDILSDFSNFKDTIHPDACIALIACDRFEYFEKCVQALAQNSEIKDLDVFLFLDKPTDASKFENSEKHISALKAVKPDAYIVQRPCNFGAGRNIIDARRQLFDTLGYDYVFIIEDDVVVAPNFLELMLRLWSWIIRNEYQNTVGVIQGWQYNVLINPTTYVDISIDNLWAYCMSRRCWEDIKHIVYQYERDYLFCRYNERPHRTIFKWYESLPVSEIRKGYPISDEKLAMLRGSLGSVQSNQEGCILTALYRQGWLRLSTQANLAEYIGRSGIGKCEEFENMDFEAVKIQTIDIEEFEEAL